MNTYDVDARIGYGYIFTAEDIESLSLETQREMRACKRFCYEMYDGTVFFGILLECSYKYDIISWSNYTNLSTEDEKDLKEDFYRIFKGNVEFNFYLMRFKFTDY